MCRLISSGLSLRWTLWYLHGAWHHLERQVPGEEVPVPQMRSRVLTKEQHDRPSEQRTLQTDPQLPLVRVHLTQRNHPGEPRASETRVQETTVYGAGMQLPLSWRGQIPRTLAQETWRCVRWEWPLYQNLLLIFKSKSWEIVYTSGCKGLKTLSKFSLAWHHLIQLRPTAKYAINTRPRNRCVWIWYQGVITTHLEG